MMVPKFGDKNEHEYENEMQNLCCATWYVSWCNGIVVLQKRKTSRDFVDNKQLLPLCYNMRNSVLYYGIELTPIS